jgi:hypothetical protein
MKPCVEVEEVLALVDVTNDQAQGSQNMEHNGYRNDNSIWGNELKQTNHIS